MSEEVKAKKAAVPPPGELGHMLDDAPVTDEAQRAVLGSMERHGMTVEEALGKHRHEEEEKLRREEEPRQSQGRLKLEKVPESPLKAEDRDLATSDSMKKFRGEEKRVRG